MKKDLKEAILGIEVTQFDGQKADLEELVNPKKLEKIISDWMPEVLSQELPVIPKVVADFIERTKPMKSLRVAFILIEERKEQDHEDKLAFWIEEGNSETFARAWLDGFTVEEEQKYYVLNSEGETMIRKDDSEVRTSSGFRIDNRFKNENYKLTEQEIKDYDERYWPFAVKVEELEE